MNRLSYLIFLLVTVLNFALAQFDRGLIELTISGAYGSQVLTLSGEGVPGHSTNQSYGYLNTSFGYYLIDNLAIQPQYGLLAMNNSFPAHSLILSLVYSRRFGESPLAFFIHGGYGKSNSFSFPMLGNLQYPERTNWYIGIINTGVGLKYLISDIAAFQAEFNYRREYFSDTYYQHSYYPPYTTYSNVAYYSYTYSNVLLGMSIFIR